MANSLCFTPLTSLNPPNKPGLVVGNSTARKLIWMNGITQNCKNTKFQSFEAKTHLFVCINLTRDVIAVTAELGIRSISLLLQATDSNQSTKQNSIVCAKCEGNGAILCPQCEGNGVNSVDHFNGRFKAGGLCWLCSWNTETRTLPSLDTCVVKLWSCACSLSSERVKNLPIRLKDFASVESMREEINEVVAFLQNPKAFQEMGAHAPRLYVFIYTLGSNGVMK
ncbi:hypothetical protein TEA_004486 [Camellia sinensis var. sinensis]|uniref:BSD2 cysteine rich domain-containing protein n=1 Tax=Camellia sinensis var. sinensis TaxID=542762 RepID=A0A4S4ED44_CAMSN|nr:hypothetical protein TEA_004486 [Camellia sinensis var. sinensis]